MSKTTREVAASMVAASAVPLVLNWTDFVKTRMQGAVAPGASCIPYRGSFLQTVKRMLAEDGILAVYSTAMGASLLREWTVFGTRIGLYPFVRDKMSELSKGRSGGEAGLASKFQAGVALGILSGVAATPPDLARIRMQAEAGCCDANRILTTGLRAGLPQQVRSSPHCFRVMLSEGGFLGLFRGCPVNVMRSICMTCGTVPVYEHTKHLAKTHLGVADSPSLHLGAGIVSGLVGTTVTAPADVLRTRVMQSGEKGGVGVAGAARSILHEYGPLGFVRGWLPAYMRVGPLFLLMPMLVEQVRKRLFGLDYLV